MTVAPYSDVARERLLSSVPNVSADFIAASVIRVARLRPGDGLTVQLSYAPQQFLAETIL
jgi:hypothetical protein